LFILGDVTNRETISWKCHGPTFSDLDLTTCSANDCMFCLRTIQRRGQEWPPSTAIATGPPQRGLVKPTQQIQVSRCSLGAIRPAGSGWHGGQQQGYCQGAVPASGLAHAGVPLGGFLWYPRPPPPPGTSCGMLWLSQPVRVAGPDPRVLDCNALQLQHVAIPSLRRQEKMPNTLSQLNCGQEVPSVFSRGLARFTNKKTCTVPGPSG